MADDRRLVRPPAEHGAIENLVGVFEIGIKLAQRRRRHDRSQVFGGEPQYEGRGLAHGRNLRQRVLVDPEPVIGAPASFASDGKSGGEFVQAALDGTYGHLVVRVHDCTSLRESAACSCYLDGPESTAASQGCATSCPWPFSSRYCEVAWSTRSRWHDGRGLRQGDHDNSGRQLHSCDQNPP